MFVHGVDFGPDQDLADIIRRRMSGSLLVDDDPNDPTLHAWLGRAYQALRREGEHARLGEAFASLIADPEPKVREAVAWFVRAWPDDPAAGPAAREALTRHRALYADHPDTLEGSPAGLEGVLLGAVGKTITGADDPLLDELRAAARRPQMLGPCLPALATHAPEFLLAHAADLASSSPYWVRTFLGILDKGQLPFATRWILPRSDVVARIARGSLPSGDLERAVQVAVSDPTEQAALRRIAQDPGPIGDYDVEPVDGDDVDALRRRCLAPRGCNGVVLSALGEADPGFAARALGRVLRATPGALGPLLAWSSRHGLDIAQTTRRIAGLGVHPRDRFMAVAAGCLDPRHQAAVESAWPE